jgi:transcriptional regulator GlxA family with amidase domain
VAGDQGEAGAAQFQSVVRRLRVVALAQRLRDPASAAMPIEALTLETGFLDESIARDAFVQAFGVEPDLWRTMRFA